MSRRVPQTPRIHNTRSNIPNKSNSWFYRLWGYAQNTRAEEKKEEEKEKEEAFKRYINLQIELKRIAPTNEDFKQLSPRTKHTVARMRAEKNDAWVKSGRQPNKGHSNITYKWLNSAYTAINTLRSTFTCKSCRGRSPGRSPSRSPGRSPSSYKNPSRSSSSYKSPRRSYSIYTSHKKSSVRTPR